ncbi:TRAP transporter small permease [Acuticoccus sp.]|uniref:TRAP transporter small permease n=1 Tax=Acuticoccus sp. TaxID=1904378 RepID=UPI003B52F626
MRGPVLLAAVDAVSGLAARVSDVLVVLIAIMLAYEVGARYLFLAPTKWTHDVSIVLQIWLTYLGMAFVLRQRDMIRITALIALLGPNGRRIIEAVSLVAILAFCVVAFLAAWDVVRDSLALGRRQPTMLAMPNWIGEVPVIVGFALLFLQALCDLVRLPFRPAPTFAPPTELPDDEGRDRP